MMIEELLNETRGGKPPFLTCSDLVGAPSSSVDPLLGLTIKEMKLVNGEIYPHLTL
jgi:hypothetical protein